jgi:hypothetical protein
MILTNDNVLKYVNYICVKENSGSTLKPDQYNTVILASNVNMFNKQVTEAQLISGQSKMPFNETLFNMAALREFQVLEDITFTAGNFDVTTLTHSFAYWGSMITLYNGVHKKIEILTVKEYAERRTNMIYKQLSEYPGALFNGNIIKVLPSNIATAEFVYMKNPVKPVYDYYIDADLNYVYLPVGTTHLLATGGPTNLLATGETGSAGQTSGTTVTSLTVEPEWNDLYFVEFCNEVLQKVSINLTSEQLRQYVKEVEGKQL